MRVGLQIPVFKWPGGTAEIAPRLAQIARTAEQAGFYSLWVMDHFFQIPSMGPKEDPMLEAYSTLSYLAAHTEKVRLGALVTAVVYRHPGVLVKTATTLDVLSGGRSYLGIGAAWFEQEAQALGIPFPPQKAERFVRLEEALQIIHRMWSGDRTPYHGRFYQLEEPLNSPPPLSQPHPPLMIGGMGEKKTIPLVARYAAACNFTGAHDLDNLRHKLDVLKAACEAAGRDYNEIERTVLGSVDLRPGGMTAQEMVAWIRELAALGFQHVIVNMPNVHEITPLEIIGREVIPALAGL